MERVLPSIYLITDRHKVPGGKAFPEIMDVLLRAGVKIVQLREKDLATNELFQLAKKLRIQTREYGCKLVINDRIDVALAVQADGVHLGQQSLSPLTARKLLGPEAFIGVSTHSLIELQLAQDQGADFVTYGPVYFTPSKAEYGPPVGIPALEQAVKNATIPVFALGGIKSTNIREVLSTGCYGVAAISALLSTSSPAEAYQQFSATVEILRNSSE
ncbi:MAG: thiamine phosphate synthase [Desulfuromonadales bacterium]|nr:thiamine phosphate synthase [Desulfuromonadales bacterium]MBN2792232.1 thiamine phosphate synthase [Desulfuromonadales bacterium]